MNKFYLNSAIGMPKTVADGSKALGDVLCSFDKLVKNKDLNVSQDIVLDKTVMEQKFGEHHLCEYIEHMDDEFMRRLAYIYMQKAYPMTEYVGMEDEEIACADRGYQMDGEDATEVAVANNHGLFLFTIAHKESLRANQLTFTATAKAPEGNCYPDAFSMHNLFGGVDNETYIQNLLQERVLAATAKLDQIKEFGETLPQFEKQFAKLCIEEQQEIIENFKEAKRMELLYPIVANGTIVRSETGWKKYMVAEVALPNPFATRIYISQNAGKLYISYIGHKRDYSNMQKQRRDIQRAEKLLKDFLGLK